MAYNLPNLKPGDLVAGRFRIVESIGSGGFSIVYRAHQEGMNRFVALKVLKPKASADARIVERFRREALYASHLSHPNTITLFDYGQTDDGLCFIAMEYLVGMDLSAVVQNRQPMDLKRVWRILTDCCRSLAEAHRLGLVHRDLKPENIFLVQRDNMEIVKVLDFGVSKAISDDFGNAGPATLAPLTQEGTVFGTPLYMAPEQAMAEPITAAVDVYALGHIAYEMITGRAAYEDCTNAMDVMLRQINDPPLQLPAPWTRTPLCDLIRHCTQKTPEKRFADASQMLEALLSPEFSIYMDSSDAAGQRTKPQTPAVIVPGTKAHSQDLSMDEVEEVYRWELEMLDEAFHEVRQQEGMRLVVIRGKPNTGRSNLLRAFLNKVGGNSDVHVLHRQAQDLSGHEEIGLEHDLAALTNQSLQGRGVNEVNRLLRGILGEANTPAASEEEEEEKLATESAQLSRLTSQRETFLARIAYPFRRSAEQGVLVWGLENLERIDTLTLAFLDRFFRDLQAYPAPILIVATLHSEALIERPGLLRYIQGLLQASRPIARQLQLITPGTSKSDDGLAETSSEVEDRLASLNLPDGSVSGSYTGNRRGSVASESSDEPPTLEVAASALEASLEEDSSGVAHAEVAFDQVLGHLAQLGNSVPRKLWEDMSAALLPAHVLKKAPFIIKHAHRFGILHPDEGMLSFMGAGFAETMRESFEAEPEAQAIHARLATFLNDYWDQPNQNQLRLIVDHALKGGEHRMALGLLSQAAESAYEALDLDSAREHYLHIQSVLDGAAKDQSLSASLDVPRVWLRLGEIHGALGEHGPAEDALKRAIGEARPDAHHLRGAAHKLLGDLMRPQQRFSDALRYYEEAQDFFRQAGAARAYVGCVGEIGYCALMLGRTARAEKILVQALDKAQKLHDRLIVARVHRYLGQLFTRQARYLDAVDHLTKSMDQFESLRNDREVVACLEGLGTATFAAGQYAESCENFTRAIALCATLHVAPPQAPRLGLARSLAALGNLPQAQAHLADALAVCSTLNEPRKMAEVWLYMGDLCLADSRPAEALAQYEKVSELAASIGRTALAFDAKVRQAYAIFDSGDCSRACEHLNRAATYAEAVGRTGDGPVARTHIIYLQLLEHGFRARGDMFSSLSQQTGSGDDHARTRLLCSLFQVDMAIARGTFKEGLDLLGKVRSQAALLGDYALFIPISRRQNMLASSLGQPADPRLGSGYSLGGLIPPEVGARRLGSQE